MCSPSASTFGRDRRVTAGRRRGPDDVTARRAVLRDIATSCANGAAVKPRTSCSTAGVRPTIRLVDAVRRIRRALFALGAVLLLGTLGYIALGFGPLDALYQTVTTTTTVGFREVRPLSAVGKVFTILLILVGVGTALYALVELLEALIQGHLRQHLERHRMNRAIGRLTGHVIICGWGRVGRASAQYLTGTGQRFVVIDRDAARLEGLPYPTVLGDVTDDTILQAAGIASARALIAALDTDADNVYVTLSSRALRPDLVIIARARTESSKSKLVRAGADRAVNPQLIGGRRMAAFALAPHVAEFLDVVMHDEALEFRMEQVEIAPESSLARRSLREAALAETTGVLLLAVRSSPSGAFLANPDQETVLEPHMILIVVGTHEQLDALRRLAESA
jgi:voltage-gated potassium channel